MRCRLPHVCLTLALAACHQANAPAAAPSADLPGADAIREADIRRDIFALGGDAMRGREAGTLDELRAAAWMAEAARAAGLKPAGDDGTYFQWWPMRRTRVGDGSQIAVGARALTLWKDVVALNTTTARLDLPIVYVADTAALAAMSPADVRGKAVAMTVSLPAQPLQPLDRFTIRGNFQATVIAQVRARAAAIARSGAAAAVLVSDGAPMLDTALAATAVLTARGTYGIDSAGRPAGSFARPSGSASGGGLPATVPTFWVRRDLLDAARAPDARLTALTYTETFYYPSANVVAVAPGRDSRLAGEYVLYSGHNDHDGVRYAVNGDSIWNGADDNATVNVALLAIGRAFAKAPGRRSALFVFHGAEERGLLGSRWYVMHPTVPRERIVAVLNGDMIGRNNPDSAALLGVQPPHRNSADLAQLALDANARVTHFALDTIWDRPTHPEGWYFRSDHLPYARVGIPSLMFSTLLHADYHTPRDEPSRIDVPKLTRMTRWMYATGWAVAERAERPGVDQGFRLER
jgi:hypothetical protein